MEKEDPVKLVMSLDQWQDLPPYADDSTALSSQDQDSQSFSSSSNTFMLGFVIVRIVGIQYYPGTISGREMVGLVRETLNPYDSNAIKVLNTKTGQVGHIEQFIFARAGGGVRRGVQEIVQEIVLRGVKEIVQEIVLQEIRVFEYSGTQYDVLEEIASRFPNFSAFWVL
ncbi:hypothetical protein TB2_013233 [Malus domestica]